MTTQVQELVCKFVSRSLIDERLRRYPVLAEHFAKCMNTKPVPPYYCHPMTWRLGTWSHEGDFQRMEELLILARELPGWSGEKHLLSSTQYHSFWNLLWQLQVAEWLTKCDLPARWQNPGPDLCAELDGQPIWIECYSVIGTYAPYVFLEELLTHVHTDLKVSFDPESSFSSDDESVRHMLERCVSAVVSELSEAEKKVAEGPWPLDLYHSPQGRALRVTMKGKNFDRYDATRDHWPQTNLESHYARVLQRSINAKAGQNKLAAHHPNVVLINMVVQEEFQIASQILSRLGALPVEFALPAGIDGAIWTLTGIDQQVEVDLGNCLWKLGEHPLRSFLKSRGKGAP